MKIFDEASVDCPPVRVTPLERDDRGKELLDRLAELQQQLADANHRASAASRPLPDLLARADELAAQSMAGRASADEAEAAEEKVREARNDVEAARREARQCSQAITLVEEQLDERARALYRENTRHVQNAHKELVQATLDAQKRASTLLRVLREFEMRYARYTDSSEPEPYPRYLRDEERTRPPRSIMGPSQSPSGHVYAAGDATEWMQRASQLLGVDGPAIVDVETLDFESDDASISLDDCKLLDAASTPPSAQRRPPTKAQPASSASASDHTQARTDTENAEANRGTDTNGDGDDRPGHSEPHSKHTDPDTAGDVTAGDVTAGDLASDDDHPGDSADADPNAEADVDPDADPDADVKPAVTPDEMEIDPAERSHQAASE